MRERGDAGNGSASPGCAVTHQEFHSPRPPTVAGADGAAPPVGVAVPAADWRVPAGHLVAGLVVSALAHGALAAALWHWRPAPPPPVPSPIKVVLVSPPATPAAAATDQPAAPPQQARVPTPEPVDPGQASPPAAPQPPAPKPPQSEVTAPAPEPPATTKVTAPEPPARKVLPAPEPPAPSPGSERKAPAPEPSPPPAPRPDSNAEPALAGSPPLPAAAPGPERPTPAVAAAADGPVAGPETMRRHYVDRLVAAIEAHKHYPTRARRRRQEGVVELAITIARDGTVAALQVARGSGFRSLDRAALESAGAVGPLPPLPPGIDQLQVTVPLEYRLL